jgi:predicted RNase H-like HicB family nuclease
MTTLHFDQTADARDHFKAILDAAEHGSTATVCRDNQTAAVVDTERLRCFLAKSTLHAKVVHEAGSWWVFVPGLLVSADGATFDEAISEMVDALREYAEDWQDHLSSAPNRSNDWALVQLVGLSTDDQLREWLSGVN